MTYHVHDKTTGSYIRTITLPCTANGRCVPSNANPATLLAAGIYPIANRPTAPGENYVWRAADHAYVLVDDVSTPDGEWEAIEPPDTSERDAVIASIREVFAALGITPIPSNWTASVVAIKALPESLAVTNAAIELMALRSALDDVGGNWNMVINE